MDVNQEQQDFGLTKDGFVEAPGSDCQRSFSCDWQANQRSDDYSRQVDLKRI